MVERVARGRLFVPAAAALGLMAVGIGGADQVSAASRDTTIQIRVQVVESCQIRVSNVGRVAQSCGGGGVGASLPSLPALRSLPSLPSLRRLVVWPIDALPSFVRIDPDERTNRANQRAKGIARRIAQRVRYITIAY